MKIVIARRALWLGMLTFAASCFIPALAAELPSQSLGGGSDKKSPGETSPGSSSALMQTVAVGKSLKKLFSGPKSQPKKGVGGGQSPQELMRLGVWIAGPLTVADVDGLEKLANDIQKSNGIIIGVRLTGFTDAQYKAALESAKNASVVVLPDFRDMTKEAQKVGTRYSIDSIVFFGALRARSIPEEFATALGKDASLSKTVEQAVLWSVNEGKHVYIEVSNQDREIWKPVLKNSPDNALSAVNKGRRTVWLGGEIPLFIDSVRTGKLGQKDLRNFK